MAFNIGSIFDTFKGWLGIGEKAINDGVPVAQEVVTNASNLFDIIKGALKGNDPSPEQLAAAEKARKDLADQLAKS